MKILLIGSILFILLASSLIFYSTMSGDSSNNQIESEPDKKLTDEPAPTPCPGPNPKPNPTPSPGPSPTPKPGPNPKPPILIEEIATLKPNYKLVTHENSIKNIEHYKKQLEADINISGKSLRSKLATVFSGKEVKDLTTNEFIELLLATKWPIVFADRQSYVSHLEWSPEDARVLGDIGVAMSVKAFDDGEWCKPKVHSPPLDAYLLYLPGALLVKDCNVDYSEVVISGVFNEDKYFELYERRILPMLRFANDEALATKKKAIVTVPGMGCGEFARGLGLSLTNYFNDVLKKLLAKYSAQLPEISLVYFAEFAPGVSMSESHKYGNIKYRHTKSGHKDYKNLLERPEEYQIESGEDYSNHILFAFVAWDHVSLPGNDFFVFSRNTDDGVKAAATSSMTSLLGVEGEYDAKKKMYKPKRSDLGNWENIAKKIEFRLEPTEGRLLVLKTTKNNEIVLNKQE